jgi:hypothetical protein
LYTREATAGSGGSGWGRQRWSFFLQAELLDDAFDAAGADRQAGLAQSLSDDIGGGLGVEEAMPHPLADHFVGTAVVAFGAGLAVGQRGRAVLGEGVAQLEVALLAVAEGLGGFLGPQPQALAGNEHGEFAGDFVVGRHDEGVVRANQQSLRGIEAEHESTPGRGGTNGPRRKIAPARLGVQEKMAETITDRDRSRVNNRRRGLENKQGGLGRATKRSP